MPSAEDESAELVWWFLSTSAAILAHIIQCWGEKLAELHFYIPHLDLLMLWLELPSSEKEMLSYCEAESCLA